MARRRLKIGFIGGGINSAIGHVHRSAVSMDGLYSIEGGVFSRNFDINRRSAEEYCFDERRAYASVDELLQNANLDLVSILTPSPNHVDMISILNERGVSVVCEKPLLSSLDEWARVKDVWNGNGKLFTVYNYTGYPMVREARSIVAAGTLGKVLQVIVEMPNEGMVRPPRIGGEPKPPQSWRLKDAIIPHAALDLATHAIQLSRFIVQEELATAVGRFANHSRFENIKDTHQIVGELTNGASFSLWISKTALGCRNGLNIRIFCEKGSLYWVQTEPESLSITDGSGLLTKIDRSNSSGEGYHARYDRFKVGHPAGYIEAFANYYRDIFDVITGKEPGRANSFLFGLSDSYEELVVLETLVKKGSYERKV